MTAGNKSSDDFVIDDKAQEFTLKKRHAEKDERKEKSKQLSGRVFFIYLQIKLTITLNKVISG